MKASKVFYAVFDVRTGKELARFDDEKSAKKWARPSDNLELFSEAR